MKVFANGDASVLNEDERELLKYYLSSGTYGTKDRAIQNCFKKQRHKTGKKAKREYIRNRVFPNLKTMTVACPFVNNNPLLYPAGMVVRFARGLTVKRKKLGREYQILKKYDDK